MTLSFVGWDEADVAPLVIEAPVREARWGTIFIWAGGWALAVAAGVTIAWMAVRNRVRPWGRRPSHSGDRTPGAAGW